MDRIEIRNRKFGPLLGVGLLLGVGACSWIPDISLPSIGGGGSNAPIGETVTSVSTRVEQRDGHTSRGISSNSDFAGAVIADEPNAALIARQILEQGGNAADAATALYFALSVTYPAAAGLGGGGVCVAHDTEKDGRSESIGFLPRSTLNGGAVAVPGNVRGFVALQARYGSKSWAELVAPAERLAAVGMPVSRATASQLADANAIIQSNPSLGNLFGKDGQPLKELDTLTQLNLAATLALVRSRNTNGFYSGTTASLLVAKSGGALSLEDLKNYRPEIAPAQAIDSSDMKVLLPATSLGAGTFAASVWENVGAGNTGDIAQAGQRAAISLGAGNSSAFDGDYGSTAFAVVDGKGGAVACGVTMNGAFGAARVAEGSGVVFAAAPSGGKSAASAFLMPLLVTSENNEKVYFAGAGAGAPKGAATIAYAAKTMLSESSSPDVLAAGPADARSPANAIACSRGLPGSGVCTVAVNPKGHGVGVSAIAPDS